MLKCLGICFGKNMESGTEDEHINLLSPQTRHEVEIENSTTLEQSTTTTKHEKKDKVNPNSTKAKDKVVEKENDKTYDSADETKDITEQPSLYTGAISDDEKEMQGDSKTPVERKVWTRTTPVILSTPKVVEKLIQRQEDIKKHDDLKSELFDGNTNIDFDVLLEQKVSEVEKNQQIGQELVDTSDLLVKETSIVVNNDGIVSPSQELDKLEDLGRKISDPFPNSSQMSDANTNTEQIIPENDEIGEILKTKNIEEAASQDEEKEVDQHEKETILEEIKQVDREIVKNQTRQEEMSPIWQKSLEEKRENLLIKSREIEERKFEPQDKKVPDYLIKQRLKINETSTVVESDRFKNNSQPGSGSSSPVPEDPEERKKKRRESKIRMDEQLAKQKEKEKDKPVWVGDSPSNLLKRTDSFVKKETESLQKEKPVWVTDSPTSILKKTDSFVKKEQEQKETEFSQVVAQKKLRRGSTVISRQDSGQQDSPLPKNDD